MLNLRGHLPFFIPIGYFLKVNMVVVLIFLITSCKEPAMDMYNPDQLTTIKVESVNESTIKIIFNTMLETLYYCPGLDVSEKNNTFFISFVRCPIKEKCPVTLEAQQSDGGNYFVLLKNEGKAVSIQYKGGEQKIYP